MLDTIAIDSPRPRALARPAIKCGPVCVAAGLLGLGALYLGVSSSWRQGALLLIGGLGGMSLYHAAFGFTTAWRLFVADRRGTGIRAQMFMLAVTCAVFFPVLASGQLFGHAVRGSVSPLAIGVPIGAFLFGIGMQLGGGCASGTLYKAGGGDPAMFVTLGSFIAGSVVGAAHLPAWQRLPGFKPLSVVQLMGPWTALAVCLAVFAAIGAATLVVERRHHGETVSIAATESRWNLLRGPWAPMTGAMGLAVVNILTLAVAGRPWGVTSAFALWGAKVLAAAGAPAVAWGIATPEQLRASVLADVTSVMDLGIVLGALVAAGLAGRFAPDWRLPRRTVAAALVGGLLLGYGARIAYGCNIGAYFSGIASGSVHGWVWLVFAFAGSYVGTVLRPRFGLPVERACAG